MLPINPICDCCGEETEFIECRWEKFMLKDDEELVSVFRCSNCGVETSRREEVDISDEL